MCLCLARGGDSGTAASGSSQKVVYRKDYKRPDYLIDQVELDFELDAEITIVKSVLKVKPSPTCSGADLSLNGEAIELISITIDGKTLTEKDYKIDELHLTIPKGLINPSGSEIRIENKNFPTKNTELSGLYKSGDLLTTQCEAEGFRRITYFLDRPDVMAKYQVRIVADKKLYPVLLSNGDEIKTEDLGDKHASTFADPFLKPCYLFAIVCGPLDHIKDTFTTMAIPENPSHKVDLYVYAEKKYMSQVVWAMECLKRAMKWDEEAYGRQYDLSTFRIVCIEDFNAGAMENKSLTTYNVSAILAHKDTSPDTAFERVLTVVGHEYFHNWSGNRVTVRDWFQITLKEGFTNFREQEFSHAMLSPAVKRLEDVRALRALQFPEDAGPMSHSIRPESYVSIDNFYTMTVYEKGSEVIRMLKTIVGDAGFRKGTDLYFKTYDGQAISCDEFRKAIGDANGRDFTQFELWYKQKGTPKLQVTKREYNEGKKTFTIGFKQILPENAAEAGEKVQAYHIPIVTGLIGKTAKKDVVAQKIFELTKMEDTFVFENVPEDAVPSILRGFSAPCIVESFLSTDELAFLMAYDSDPFNIYDAGQEIYKQVIFQRYRELASGEKKMTEVYPISSYIENGVREALKHAKEDAGFAAYRLTMPTVASMEVEVPRPVDPIQLANASRSVMADISATFRDDFRKELDAMVAESAKMKFEPTKEQIGRRSMQNQLLRYLCETEDTKLIAEYGKVVAQYYEKANNFNDKSAAHALIVSMPCAEREAIISKHYALCKDDICMLDGWFRQLAATHSPSALEDVKKLVAHKDYAGCTNPNRFRAVARTVSTNPTVYHHPSGEGYMLAAQEYARFDKINSYNAALTTKPLINFQNYSPERQSQMVKALEWMKKQGLSKNTLEIVERGLAAYKK